MTPPRDLIHWIELYQLGELSPDRTEWLNTQCEQRQLSLEQMCQHLQEDNTTMLAQYPLDAQRAAIETRTRSHDHTPGASQPSRHQGWHKTIWQQRRALTACAVVCACLGVVWVGPLNTTTELPSTTPAEGVRTKGAAALTVWLKTDNTPTLLHEGSRLNQGDQIQLHFNSAGRAHGVILSLDGRGVVTDHGPAKQHSLLVATQGDVDDSYILDDAPGYERFFWFTSNQPIQRQTLRQAVEDLYKQGGGQHGQPALPSHIRVTTVVMEKTQ